MAMLAEPRQKRRYNLVPKGKALFEDSDRFGTKMLAKMGWAKGKGLGRNENGQQEFIRIRYKNDPNGLGYLDRDDQWTEHEKHFNGLLDNLKTGGDSGNNSTSEEVAAPNVGLGFVSESVSKGKMKDKISGQSLEEKSKNSKVRVHYKKYTKGKDMSQYSEKDLANIFGKKATPDETNIYSQFQAFNVGGNENDENKEEPTVQKSPMEMGTQIINTGVSVTDYFKLKMASLKEKRGEVVVNGVDSKDVSKSETFGKKKKSKKVSPEVEEDENVQAAQEPIMEAPRKKKKSKKQDLHVEEKGIASIGEELNGYPEEENTPATEVLFEEVARKKKKGKKHEEEKQEELPSKKKRSNQSLNGDLNGCVDEECTPPVQESIEETPRKSKKVKKQEGSCEVITIPSFVKQNVEKPVTEVVENSSSYKKKSKKPSVEGVSQQPNELPQSPVEVIPMKKNKNRKRLAEEIEPTVALNDDEESIAIIPEKKNKFHENPAKEVLSTPDTTQESSKQTLDAENPSTEKKNKKNKKKNKSQQSPQIEVSSQHDLNHSKDNCLLDIYTISSFCAEKFRHIVLHQYNCSNISAINGYGFADNLQLDIKEVKHDQERIMNLWSGTVDKYTHKTPKRKIYSTYMTKAKEARNAKNKMPKMRVKGLKRKHVFQCL